MKNLIIFASGQGTNAQAIIDYFRDTRKASVVLIVTNNATAGIVDIAVKEHIPFLLTDRKRLGEMMMIEELQDYKPSLIILAGFLLKIPSNIIQTYRGRIINIHPALLPAYGGKGMWGPHVHEAVLKNGDRQSGITIHQVDEEYDHGATLLQAHCPVKSGDTPDTLAARIHKLEHYFFPRTIDFLLNY